MILGLSIKTHKVLIYPVIIKLIWNMASESKIKCDDEYSLSAINTKNEVINVIVRKCHHCNEIVPKVGICSDCSTEYEHTNTVENPETGFIHFVYECSGCPPAKRKAQKIIKINDGNNRESRDDLIKNFL
jgi:hypothetical protein